MHAALKIWTKIDLSPFQAADFFLSTGKSLTPLYKHRRAQFVGMRRLQHPPAVPDPFPTGASKVSCSQVGNLDLQWVFPSPALLGGCVDTRCVIAAPRMVGAGL